MKLPLAILLWLSLGLSFLYGQNLAPKIVPEGEGVQVEPEAHPDILLVGWRGQISKSTRLLAHRQAGTEFVREFRLARVDVVRVRKGTDRARVLKSYRTRKDVRYVEPNYRLRKMLVPNDPQFGDLWALRNTGQNGGTPGADINITNVWARFGTGNTGIVVAVIDTGIDYTHPDLASNLWTNPGEIPGNGLDDDGNGIVDDVYGARWTNGDGTPTSGNPMDGEGHGTHVAGTIGAIGNNSIGVVGVNWAVRLMALKFLDDSGRGWTADAIAAIEYATAKGAHLSNNSWGGGGYSQALKDAIDAAGAAGQLFIAAAGNSNMDNDTMPAYPASYESWNIISVASSDRNDLKSSFSSYGRESVDLAAPGSSILSTTPSNTYSTYSGTSMATPHVAGAVALLKSIFPSLSAERLKEVILEGSRRLPAWRGLTQTGGRLDVNESARIASLPSYAEPVESFSAVSPAFSNVVLLSWSNPTSALFSHVILRESSNGFPRAWTEGTLIYSGSLPHAVSDSLPLGQRRFYAIWAFFVDGTNQFYSAARFASVRVGGEPDDYFTEIFTANDNDLAFKSLLLVPDASLNRYFAFTDVATNFPVSPSGGTPLYLADDAFAPVSISGGQSVKLYGTSYTNLFVGSNGYITFGTGDTTYVESLSAHFDRPRVSMLFDDLNPAAGGAVSYRQLADRFAVTFERVPEYGASTENSFQVELFFDGRIRITWLGLALRDGLAGISAGGGVPENFQESNLSEYPPYDELRVFPIDRFETHGVQGGPFVPNSRVYTLTNAGAVSVSWTSTSSAAWVGVSPAHGTLPAGQALAVTVMVNGTAGTLSPGLYETSVVFSNSTSGQTHVRPISLAVAKPGYTALYCADSYRRPDPVLPALRRAGYLTDVATNWADFEAMLNNDSYSIAVAISHGLSPPGGRAAVSNHLASGRRALLIDRSKDSAWAALFGAALAGADNRTPVWITEPDLANEITNPVPLSNPGYQQFSWGFIPLANSESLAVYRDNGTAVVWGNNRRSAIVGFTADSLSTNDAVRFFENLITLVEGGGDMLTVQPSINWLIDGYELGPFGPAEREYYLTNLSSNPVSWVASASSNWVAITPSTGMIFGGDTVIVTARVTSAADGLPAGDYFQSLVFSNAISGKLVKRHVQLRIWPIPGEIAVSDSVSPTNDLFIPFGELIIGRSRTEQITIRNVSSQYSLEISGIALLNTDISNAAARISSPSEEVPANVRPADRTGADFHPEILIVGFKPGVETAAREELHRDIGATRVHRYGRIAADVVRISKDASLVDTRKRYLADPRVAYADLNYVVRRQTVPDDPLFDQLWGLRNTGQTGGTPGADIRAVDAWGITQGGTNIVVAVIDTGIDYTHADLAANMWVNPGEIPGNGLDDDGNGIVDDVYGARWTSGTGAPTSGDPMDDNSHGTHVAGTIGAIGNNGIGVVGVNWRTRMMALKFLSDMGSGYIADAISALEYAVAKGARISNNSWGGGGYSQAMKDMIDAAANAGHLFVAAAGNSGTDNDVTPEYPATYPCANIVSVASSDHNDQRSSFSCYGRTTVHLAAPGSSIHSTIPGDGYATFSGTSMATPHVAGAAALLWSLNPSVHYSLVKNALTEGVDILPDWTDRVISNGRLNVLKSLQRFNPHFRMSGIPSLPATLPPGASLTLDVTYEPINEGSHTGRIMILSNDAFSPTTIVSLAGSAVPDSLAVQPLSGFITEGPPGGPFAPTSATYSLVNIGATALSWSATASGAWVTLDTSSGVLPPASTTRLTVALSPTANSLGTGVYVSTLLVVNQSSGITNTRPIRLTVAPRLCDAVDACEWAWTTGGNAPWYSQTDVTADGVDAAASGVIGDDQISWISTVVEGPGALSFDWKVSSETGYDFLSFSINGVTNHQISGEVGWVTRHYQLAAGVHTLRWSYEKDFSVAWGDDRGWLDRVYYRRYLFGRAHDHAGNYGDAPSNFVHGANQGRGFEPWQIITAGSAVADLFTSTAGSGNIDSANGLSFRFFGGSGGTYVEAIRPFAAPLRSGDVFRVTLAYNWNGGARGVNVLAFDDYELFNVNFGPGDVLSFKWGNASPVNVSTYWSPTTVLHVAVEQLAGSQLRVELRRNDGFVTNFTSSGLPAPAAKVKFYNGGHPGDNVRYALFVNHLSITRSNAHDADGDGLPDWWETEYFGNPTNAAAGALAAEGSYTLAEAWLADLNPLDPNAAYPRAGIRLNTNATLSVLIDSTSTARVYGVDWTTNLLDPIWIPHVPMATGTGGSIAFPVTNTEPSRIYRTLIRQPN